MDTKEVRRKEIREGRRKEGGMTSQYTKAYNLLTWRISWEDVSWEIVDQEEVWHLVHVSWIELA
jgi:hypothetical protein